MKKIILLLCMFLMTANAGFCTKFDYQRIYRELDMPNFSYVHNIDPDQYYDIKDATWSPYPLFRLNSYLYFKNITIPPGYYALTPREYKGNWYVLFKESGFVKYIIPVYNKEFVPEYFYEEHLPKRKLTAWQTVKKHVWDFICVHIKSAKRKPEVQSYLEVSDLDNNFISIIVYFGEFRYYIIVRTVQL